MFLDNLDAQDNKQIEKETNVSSTNFKLSDSKLGAQLAESFRYVADFLTFSAEQLFEMIDLVDDPEWRLEVYLAGMGRCHDFKNLDMIKHKVKSE